MDLGVGGATDASTPLQLHRQEAEPCLRECAGADLCPRCRRAVRIEALLWLRDLSDDVFGERDGPEVGVIVLPSSGYLSPGAQRYS